MLREIYYRELMYVNNCILLWGLQVLQKMENLCFLRPIIKKSVLENPVVTVYFNILQLFQ